MTAQTDVLIASADLQTCRTLASILSQWGLEPIFCSTVSKAKAILAQKPVPLVFCEDQLTDGSFRDLLHARTFAQLKARVAVIFRMAGGNGNGDVQAMELSAFNAVACPYRLTDVQRVILDAMRDAPGPNRPDWEIT